MTSEFSSLLIESTKLEEVCNKQRDAKAAMEIFRQLSEKPNNLDIENLKCTLKEYPHMLNYKFYGSWANYMPLLYFVKYKLDTHSDKKKQLIDAIVDIGCQISDKIHYKATKCDPSIVDTSDGETIFGDTPLSFFLKFGSPTNEGFVKTVEKLTNSFNVHQLDYQGRTPLTVAIQEYLLLLEEDEGKLAWEKAIEKLVDAGSDRFKVPSQDLQAFELRYHKLPDMVKTVQLPVEQKLFEYVIRNEPSKFRHVLGQYPKFADCTDGEHSLVQLAVILDRKSILHILLQRANLHVTTQNRPIVLAALLNHKDIFNMLLKNKEVSVEVFNEFVRYRCLNMLNDYFYAILEQAPVDLKSFNGNTPLHFAIIFGNKSTINCLLKNGASLFEENNSGLSCLKLISSGALLNFYDSCVTFSKYTDLLDNTDAKVYLNFEQLVHGRESEMDLVKMLGSTSSTKNLLQHPLIDAFINIKWYLCKKYFHMFATFKVLNCYLIILTLLNTHITSVYGLLVLETVFNGFWVYLSYKLFRNRGADFVIYCLISVLLPVDLVLISLKEFRFGDELSWQIIKQCNAIIYVLLAASILITLGYELKLAKWSIMLQKVFKTYFINMLFLMLPLLAFSVGFCQLVWSSSHKDVIYILFKTTLALAGSFDNNEFQIESPFIYLYFIVILIIIIALMNFLTGLAVNEVRRLGSNWEIISYNNVIIFIQFVERLYKQYPKLCKIFRMPCPYIQSHNCGYRMEIAIHSEEQFNGRNALRSFKLSHFTTSKIKSLYEKRFTKSVTDNFKEIELIWTRRLDRVLKEMQDLRSDLNRLGAEAASAPQ